MDFGARAIDLHRVVAEVGQIEVTQQEPAVGVRVGAHPSIAAGSHRPQLRSQLAVIVEQLVGPVTAQPFFKLVTVLRVVVGVS